MAKKQCFSKDCDVTGGGGNNSELSAAVARGGVIAGRFDKTGQMNKLASLASEIAKYRRERVRFAGGIISAFLPSILITALATWVFNVKWWITLIVILVSIAIAFLIVWKLNFLKKTIIKITFNKHLTLNILKRKDLNIDKLTVNNINSVIKEQYKNIIIYEYEERDWMRYTYKEITETELTKRKVRFNNES